MKLNSTHKLTVVGKVSAKEAGKVALIMVYTKLFLAIACSGPFRSPISVQSDH